MTTTTASQTAPLTQAESLLATGRAAYAAIADMVAALNCDYDRLRELRQEYKSLTEAIAESEYGEERRQNEQALAEWMLDYNDEYQELAAQAGDCEDRDEAQERIQEDALSVEVRSDWHAPGDKENVSPSEFRILLATGGPAVQIRGELSEHGDPCSAWLEVQDWGTPWTRYYDASEDVLLAYAQWFYFSE